MKLSFDPTRIDSWKKFLEKQVVPIAIHSQKLIDYRKNMKERIKDKTIGEIKGTFLEKLLLGGVTPNGKYMKQSLAKFTKDGYGISLGDLDKYMWGSGEDLGMLSPKIEETNFLNYLSNIHELSMEILNLARGKEIISSYRKEIKSATPPELEDTESLRNILSNFLSKSLEVSIPYSEYTIFLMTVRFITRKYLRTLYETVSDREDEVELMDLLGLSMIYQPGDQRYDILGFPDFNVSVIGGELREEGPTSLGGGLLILNLLTWNMFRDEDVAPLLSSFVDKDLPNPYQDYVAMVEDELKGIGWTNPEPGYRSWVTDKYFLSGMDILYAGYGGSGSSSGPTFTAKSCEFSFSGLMDKLSPAISLGYYHPTLETSMFKYESSKVGDAEAKLTFASWLETEIGDI